MTATLPRRPANETPESRARARARVDRLMCRWCLQIIVDEPCGCGTPTEPGPDR